MRFANGTVEAAIRLSSELVRGRALPDKAIDLLENAAAFVRVSSLSRSNQGVTKEPAVVSAEDVVTVLHEQYGLSAHADQVLDAALAERELHSSLVGQDRAIEAIVAALKGLAVRRRRERPLGVLLFCGPTGVGKSLAAESLARSLFASRPESLLRLNMNEMKERHELSRLIGAPPGFIGHDQSGSLFAFGRAHAEGIVLLDEMDKAHPEIHDYFLQLFERGEASDPQGKKMSFRQHLFVMTCTSGDEKRSRVGFARASTTPPVARRALPKTLFRPDFLARVDAVVPFEPLGERSIRQLLERAARALANESISDGWNITFPSGTIEDLWEICGRPTNGRAAVRAFEGRVHGPVMTAINGRSGRAIDVALDAAHHVRLECTGPHS